MLRRIGRRLLTLAAATLVATAIVFLSCSWLPGDAAQVVLGVNATPEAVDQLRQQMGLDRPLIQRYVEWLGAALSGDWGTSFVDKTAVAPQVTSHLAVTLWLIVIGFLLAMVLAFGLGFLAALRQRHVDGFIAAALAHIGLAIPAFWAGILLVSLFSVRLGWLPANGYVPMRHDPGQWLAHLVLPAVSLAVIQASILARYVRAGLLEVMREDYYRTARSIGWTKAAALLRHGWRNAALSVSTVIGLQLAATLVGAIVIESVFALPGLGTLLLRAVSQRDLITVQAVVTLLVVSVLVVNALVDIAYTIIDPRISRADA